MRAMPADGLRRRQRHRPAQGGGAGAGRRGERSLAREIGAANTLVFGGERDRGPQHRRRRPARRAARPAARAGGRWSSAPAAPRGRRSGRCAAEGAEVEVWNRTPERGRGDLRRAGGDGGRPCPRQDELRPDRQHQRRRARRRGPVRPPAAAPRRLRRRARRSSTWSTASAAAAAGGRRRRPAPTTVDGLEVLVQQGARSLEIWTGREPALDVMRAAAARAANEWPPIGAKLTIVAPIALAR